MSVFDLLPVLDVVLGFFVVPMAFGCLLVPVMAWRNYKEGGAADVMRFACLCSHRLEAIHGDLVINKNEVVADERAPLPKLDLEQFWHRVSNDAFFEEHPVFLRIIERNDTALMRNIHSAYLQNIWESNERRGQTH